MQRQWPDGWIGRGAAGAYVHNSTPEHSRPLYVGAKYGILRVSLGHIPARSQPHHCQNPSQTAVVFLQLRGGLQSVIPLSVPNTGMQSPPTEAGSAFGGRIELPHDQTQDVRLY